MAALPSPWHIGHADLGISLLCEEVTCRSKNQARRFRGLVPRSGGAVEDFFMFTRLVAFTYCAIARYVPKFKNNLRITELHLRKRQLTRDSDASPWQTRDGSSATQAPAKSTSQPMPIHLRDAKVARRPRETTQERDTPPMDRFSRAPAAPLPRVSIPRDNSKHRPNPKFSAVTKESHMKRRAIVAVAALCGFAVLTGCSTGNDAPPNAYAVKTDIPTAAAMDPAILDAARKEGSLLVYGEANEATMKPVLAAFQSQYPDIKTSYISLGGTESFQRYLNEKATGGKTADVIVSLQGANFLDLSSAVTSRTSHPPCRRATARLRETRPPRSLRNGTEPGHGTDQHHPPARIRTARLP